MVLSLRKDLPLTLHKDSRCAAPCRELPESSTVCKGAGQSRAGDAAGSEMKVRAPGLLVEIPRDHQLQGPFVGSGGQPVAGAGFNIPDLSGVVKGSPDFVKLGVQRGEVMEGAESVRFFGGDIPFRVQVIDDSGFGVELQASQTAFVIGVDHRVVYQLPLAQVGANDRAHFGGEGARLPVVVIKAEFKIGSPEDGVMLGIRADKELADF